MQETLNLSEEDLKEVIRNFSSALLTDADINISEMCLTNDGGLKLFFEIKE